MGSQSQAIEVSRGAALCAEKSTELLAEVRLPLGMLPLADMEEVRYRRSTGFVWLRPRKPLTHMFRHLWMTSWKKRKRLKPRRPSCKRCGAAVL